MSEKQEGLCIYHGGCTDGVAAAVLWSWEFPNDTFYPGVYQQDPPWELIESASEVVILDFSYKRPVMEAIVRRSYGMVTVLDHHDTARAELEPLLKAGAINGRFADDACGAMMTWQYLYGDTGKQMPALLPYIDAQDRWLPHRNSEMIMALRSYPHALGPQCETFAGLAAIWSELMTDTGVARLQQEGVAIHRYYRQRVDETKPHASQIRIGLYEDIPAVNAPYYLASDVAGELAQTSQHGIAAVWWMDKDGGITFSLRSNGAVHVGKLCALFGGGGHPGAAGFKLDRGAALRFLESGEVIRSINKKAVL